MSEESDEFDSSESSVALNNLIVDLLTALLQVLKHKAITEAIDSFQAKAFPVQLWLFYARTLILDNRRKLNLKFTNMGLVDCGAMTLSLFDFTPTYETISVAESKQIERIKQAQEPHDVLHALLAAAESSGYLKLVRQTTEFGYLRKMEDLSSNWTKQYQAVITLIEQPDPIIYRQNLVCSLESLSAENTENFPVLQEASKKLANMLKTQKWLLRYDNLLCQKQTVLKQVETLIKDGAALTDLQVQSSVQDLTKWSDEAKEWLMRY